LGTCLNYIVAKFPLFLGKTSSGKEKIENESGKPDPGSSDDNPARKLELMRERRRIIEKENKKKKELLAQTIAERLIKMIKYVMDREVKFDKKNWLLQM
jgi:hypothetical protein